MKVTFAATGDVTLLPEEQAGLEAELEPVEALVAGESRARLHVVIARERRGDVRVSLSLDLPKRFLFASDADRAMTAAFRLARESLIRKLGRYRERSERGRTRRASRRRAEDGALAEAAARGDEEAFRRDIAGHLERLRTFLRWELRHDPRVTRRVRTRIALDDLAEEVLADLFDRLRTEPPGVTAEQWMIRRAIARLDERIREAMREPREQQPGPGEDAPPVPEEYLDEYDKLRDTFPDLYGAGEPTPLDRLQAGSGTAPERGLEDEELRAAIEAAVADLPRDWRRTFTLHRVEGYSPAEIAELLETSEDQVQEDLEASIAFLRARLR